jgi:uncharacterized oligopeptide transporter (OPT) family protein
MATVINGILSRKLPWGLVLLGVSLVIAVELLGIRSLTFAVGAYLPIGTTLPIFAAAWCAGSSIKPSRKRRRRQPKPRAKSLPARFSHPD